MRNLEEIYQKLKPHESETVAKDVFPPSKEPGNRLNHTWSVLLNENLTTMYFFCIMYCIVSKRTLAVWAFMYYKQNNTK